MSLSSIIIVKVVYTIPLKGLLNLIVSCQELQLLRRKIVTLSGAGTICV